MEFPLGKSSIKFKAIKFNDKNSKIMLDFDLGARSLKQDAVADLLVSIVDEEFFSTLRTQEQLGYAVSLEVMNSIDANAITFFVQSQEDSHTAKDVAARIERYVREEMGEILTNLSDEKLNKIKDANIKKKLSPKIDLSSDVSDNWTQIVDGKYIFDKEQKDAETIATIEKQDLIDIYTAKIVGDDARKLLWCLVGNVEDAQEVDDEISNLEVIESKYDDEETVITNLGAFKKGLNLYPRYLNN